MGTLTQRALKTQELDTRSALFLAAVCGQTYMQFNNKDGLFLVPKDYRMAGEFTAKGYDNSKERFGFVLTSERASILAFRGTGSVVNWVSDFIAEQTNYRPVKQAGLTHKGFTDIYMSTREQIFDIMKQASNRYPSVFDWTQFLVVHSPH